MQVNSVTCVISNNALQSSNARTEALNAGWVQWFPRDRPLVCNFGKVGQRLLVLRHHDNSAANSGWSARWACIQVSTNWWSGPSSESLAYQGNKPRTSASPAGVVDEIMRWANVASCEAS